MRRTHKMAGAVLAAALFAITTGAGWGDASAERGAQPADSTPSIEALSWLAGSWSGEGLGGDIEEVWLPPSGGLMAGVFRLVSGGQARVTEFMMISQAEGEAPTFRFKHYNPDYTTWEEEGPLVFTLASADENSALFQGPEGQAPDAMEYTLHPGGVLHVRVQGAGDGFTVRMTRAD